jgi:hypothetical protein
MSARSTKHLIDWFASASLATSSIDFPVAFARVHLIRTQYVPHPTPQKNQLMMALSSSAMAVLLVRVVTGLGLVLARLRELSVRIEHELLRRPLIEVLVSHGRFIKVDHGGVDDLGNRQAIVQNRLH